MTTSIVFTHDRSIPVPSVSTVPVLQGDTLELSASGDAKTVLYFSPELAAILSPAPGTSLTLDGESKTAFTFQSSDHGAYSIVAARESDAAPTHFRTVPSGHVTLGATFDANRIAFPVDGSRPSSNN